VAAFEFVIAGPPVSQQTRRRERLRAWVDAIREEAERSWPRDDQPADGPIQLELLYLFVGAAGDLDNLAKPFLDALKGLVYVDDGQVTDLIVRKRDLSQDLRLVNPSPVLALGLEQGGEFLYVMVREAPPQEAIP
jgi:crossover junction endodeoxyribonuclease RusA